MKKSSRQGVIIKIIQENDIGTQDELIQLLKEEGIEATQATVSRDVRELGIVKSATSTGVVKYVIIEQSQPLSQERLQEVVEEAVERITQVQFMLVIQTTLGSANMVAAIIDDMQLEEVAGTLAGANTLTIIAHSNELATALHQRLKSYMIDGGGLK